MTQKTIKEVVNEFKDAFGRVEFRATNHETNHVGGSKGWQEPAAPQLEINAADYMALGKLGKMVPSEGVIAGLLKISTGRR